MDYQVKINYCDAFRKYFGRIEKRIHTERPERESSVSVFTKILKKLVTIFIENSWIGEM